MKKKIYYLQLAYVLLIIHGYSLCGHAQAPQKVSYQAVATDDSGFELIEQNLGIRATVVQGSTSGTNIYQESFDVTTDDFGLFTIEVGNGNYSGGVVTEFSRINWGSGPYFLRIEMDENGGSNYQLVGINQILSVPYAIYSDYADTAGYSNTSGTANYADTANFSFTSDVANYAINADTANYVVNMIGGDPDSTNEIQTISRSGLVVTLSDGGGSYTDSVNVYQEGFGINIENNVISVDPNVVNTGGGESGCGHYVGELWGGGIVFYVYNNGCSGLIASTEDLAFNGSELPAENGAPWGLEGVSLGGDLNSSEVWNNGAINTLNIIDAGVEPGTAAILCYDYISGGYDDWYLPSDREIDLLLLQQYVIYQVLDLDQDSTTYGFDYQDGYWTSTYGGRSTFFAGPRGYLQVDEATIERSRLYQVRAIRAFDITNCFDGIQNGNETGIDCGGDCLDCVTSDCSDGIQNGDETGIDCGGSCPPCITTSCDDGTTYVTDADGNIYEVVQIGSQCWMSENLRSSTYCNGDPIPNVTDDTEWTNLTTAAWSHLGNNSQHEESLGKLYNWYSVSDDRNPCPCGWRVAQRVDFESLISFLGDNAGKQMKAFIPNWGPNGGQNGSNESGFRGYPSGWRDQTGYFYASSSYTNWWTKTENTSNTGYALRLSSLTDDAFQITVFKNNGYPLRCIKE